MSRKMLSALLVVAMAPGACDGDGGGGIMNPPSEQIEGQYSATQTIAISFGALTFRIVCMGPLVIIDQQGTTFSGMVTIDQCEDVPEGEEPISGTESFTGTIENGQIELTIDEDLATELATELECTLVSADDAFRGTATTNRLDAQFQAILDCEGEQVLVDWDVAATRVT